MDKTIKRMLHSSIWEGEQFVSLNARQRLTYIGLISIADDDGRLKGHPALVKSRIYPMDEGISPTTIDKDLDIIAKTGLIHRYSVNGANYVAHPNWRHFQRVRNDLYKPSKFPSPSLRYETVTKPLRNRYAAVTVTQLNLTKLNKEKTLLRQHVALSLHFHAAQKKAGYFHKAFKEDLTEDSKIVIEGAKALEMVCRIDGESIENVEELLDFVLTDDFWRDQVISLSRIRKKAENGNSKYFNIKNKMVANRRTGWENV